MYTTETFLDGQTKMMVLQNSESCSVSESKVLGRTQNTAKMQPKS